MQAKISGILPCISIEISDEMEDLHLTTENKLDKVTYERVKISNDLKAKEERLHQEIKIRQELQEKITEIGKSKVEGNRCQEKDKEIEMLVNEGNLLKHLRRTRKKQRRRK